MKGLISLLVAYKLVLGFLATVGVAVGLEQVLFELYLGGEGKHTGVVNLTGYVVQGLTLEAVEHVRVKLDLGAFISLAAEVVLVSGELVLNLANLSVDVDVFAA